MPDRQLVLRGPGASKGTTGDAKCVTEILGGKSKEVGGTKFKFGQLILRKVIKIVATRCHFLKLKCTKFDFGWGSAQTHWGSSHRSPIPLAGCKGSHRPTSKWNGETEREKKGRARGKRKGTWPLRDGEGEAKERREERKGGAGIKKRWKVEGKVGTGPPNG